MSIVKLLSWPCNLLFVNFRDRLCGPVQVADPLAVDVDLSALRSCNPLELLTLSFWPG
jgi:hypothetical protein